MTEAPAITPPAITPPTISPLKTPPSRAERIIDFIENYLFIPEGKHVGKPFILAPFQKEIIYKIYDNPAVTRRAIVSMGRKNGKTSLIAALLVVHLVGPEARKNSQLYSCANDRSQAAIVFKLAYQMILMSPVLRDIVKPRESSKQLIGTRHGTVYSALSREAKTAVGTSPSFTIFDELGQVTGPTDKLYDALDTGSAAQEHPLTIIISTQAESESALLSILINSAKAGFDPKTVLCLWEAPEDMDPFTEEALRLANPGYDIFMNKDVTKNTMENAKRMPSAEASYRNYVLNQRVDVNAAFVSKVSWQACGSEIEPWEGKDVYAGLDLSTTTDLTSLVLAYHSSDKVNVKPFFWLPGDDLAGKSNQDGADYVAWSKMGYVDPTPGKVINYDFVAFKIKEISEKANIKKLAFDRYAINHLKAALQRQGMSDDWIENTMTDFGQGFISMSPAIRYLEELILDEKLAHGNHPCLAYCMSNTSVELDAARNRKLVKTKGRPNGRIDGAIAMTMAIGAMQNAELIEPKRSSYLETSGLIVF